MFVEHSDQSAQALIDAGVRAYYEGGGDAEDDAWSKATAPHIHRAWDED